jgi:hypothetical protein
MTSFRHGDRVWFISKFGDRVTGTYQRDEDVPGIHGDVRVHIVSSHNAFGRPSREPTSCIVTFGKLNHEEPVS